MFAATLGAAVTIVLAVFTAGWYLSGRVSRVEKAAEAIEKTVDRHFSETLPSQLEAAVLKHQIKCPAVQGRGIAAAGSE